ncbi:MAG TPA: NAD(P)-dependent oxidoreductase [Gemmatimonadales bacterium]|nr:NAD(P)-dependent oxidoreductase [Gemmatimonadales bacterium]
MTWWSAYQGRRVLVLGAGGFIGRRVARRLAEAEAELSCGVREAARAPRLPGTLRETDLTRPGAAAELVNAVRPSVCFNLAGYGVLPGQLDPALARRLNSELPHELAEACASAVEPSWPGQHLVHVGSAAEYGRAGGDLAETTQPEPMTLYGNTKLAGTRAVAATAATGRVRAVTARLFTVYGPGEPPGRLLPSLIAAAQAAEPIPLTAGRQRRDFTWLDDVVEGLLRLGLSAGPDLGPINLATGRLTSVRSFVETAAGILGIVPGRLQFGALPTRPDEMAHDAVNLTRLRARCGWIPGVRIEEGIRRTVQEG